LIETPKTKRPAAKHPVAKLFVSSLVRLGGGYVGNRTLDDPTPAKPRQALQVTCVCTLMLAATVFYNFRPPLNPYIPTGIVLLGGVAFGAFLLRQIRVDAARAKREEEEFLKTQNEETKS
jgi:hypothetical protein